MKSLGTRLSRLEQSDQRPDFGGGVSGLLKVLAYYEAHPSQEPQRRTAGGDGISRLLAAMKGGSLRGGQGQ